MQRRSKDWPKIHKRKHRDKDVWSIDCGMIDGKRKILTRSTRKEAKQEAARIRARFNRVGSDALKLSDEKLRDAVRAYEKLGNRLSLVETVDFYLLHAQGEGGVITIGELVDAYEHDRRRSGRAEATLVDLHARLGRFANEFGETQATHISTRCLEDWLDTIKTPTAKRNMRVHLSGLFNFALKRRYVVVNPVTAITTPKIRKDRRPGILTVPQCRHLMQTVKESDPEVTTWFTLALFAGLRPKEAERMDWRDIDLDRGDVFVSAAISKNAHDRYVTLQPTAVEWLLPHRKRSGPVFWSRRAYNRVRRKADIEWSHDVLRHSFGSYHLAAFRNAGDTAEQMGHKSDTSMLFRHYRRATRQEDGTAFFDIRPGQRGEENSAVSV